MVSIVFEKKRITGNFKRQIAESNSTSRTTEHCIRIRNLEHSTPPTKSISDQRRNQKASGQPSPTHTRRQLSQQYPTTAKTRPLLGTHNIRSRENKSEQHVTSSVTSTYQREPFMKGPYCDVNRDQLRCAATAREAAGGGSPANGNALRDFDRITFLRGSPQANPHATVQISEQWQCRHTRRGTGCFGSLTSLFRRQSRAWFCNKARILQRSFIWRCYVSAPERPITAAASAPITKGK